MRSFKINKDYNDMGCNIYKKDNITIISGLTVLVGCNGMGKTTLLHQLKRKLEKDKIPVISFDNLIDGGDRAREKAGFYGDMEFLATAVMSSEGENINMNIGRFAGDIGRFVRKYKGSPEMWILLDAVDSGLSIDNIIDIKQDLFDVVIEDNPNTDVYIIVAANGYEFARNENCFDVYEGKYLKFKDYEQYRDFVLKTRKEKDGRVYEDRNNNDEEGWD